MSKSKHTMAFETARRLHTKRQDELADAILETAARDFVDRQIASGETSYASDGGKSPREIFERLISRNPYS